MAKVVSEDVAEDFVFSSGKAKGTPAISHKDLEGDSIVKAIREQIIFKQTQALQNAIAREIADAAKKSEFEKLNKSELNDFLKSPEGKQQALKALDTPILQKELANLEVAGHKYIHENFKDSFKDIQWKPGPTTDSRTNTINDEFGNKICDLIEKTISHDPVTVKLADGTEKTVSSYRSVDFPKQLEGTGPMDVSMAVKDSNGKNIAASKAVYFTAHYDDSGKLQEVSTPMPLKFMGEGNNAIGYIERDGEIYTLPVTKGKYQEMMQEVAINKGMGLDLSTHVEVETPAIDKVVTHSALGQEKPSMEKEALSNTKLDPAVAMNDEGPAPTLHAPAPHTWKSARPSKIQPETKSDHVASALSEPIPTTPPPPPGPPPIINQASNALNQPAQENLSAQIAAGIKLKAATSDKAIAEQLAPAVNPNAPPPPPMPDKLKAATLGKGIAEQLAPAVNSNAPPPPPMPNELKAKQDSSVKPLANISNQADQGPIPDKSDLLAQIRSGIKLKNVGPEVVEPNKEPSIISSLGGVLDSMRKGIAGEDNDKKSLAIEEAKSQLDFYDTREDALKALKNALKLGDSHLAAALVQVSAEDKNLLQYTKEDLKKAYDKGMDFAAKQKTVEDAERIQRAAGAISEKAGIKPKHHTNRMKKDQQVIKPKGLEMKT